ncbi:AIG2 family protein [Hyaloraphidium curvatum]|nr:AIG2 family protein [Hyaloraphidium curvatum]
MGSNRLWGVELTVARDGSGDRGTTRVDRRVLACSGPSRAATRRAMFVYFAYGSNVFLPALQAKGIVPLRSVRGTLRGWRLRFDLVSWFPEIDGGMATVRPGAAEDAVEGVVHFCGDGAVEKLDFLEANGTGYLRTEVVVETDEGPVEAHVYAGTDYGKDDSMVPSRRYLSLLLKGAEAAGLSDAYLDALRRQPCLPDPDPPPFVPPEGGKEFTCAELESNPELTAVLGHVFDMSARSRYLDSAAGVFGGRDTTLFHLRRHDSCAGTETAEDLMKGRVSDSARQYVVAWTHAYSHVFRYAGRLVDGCWADGSLSGGAGGMLGDGS